MKKLLALLAALTLLLTACADRNVIDGEVSEISVYRLIRQEYRTGDELLRAEKISYTDVSTTVEGAALALKSIPGNPSLESAFPADISILKAEKKGRSVYVSMSDAYYSIYGVEKTIIDACITLTMCSIPNVDYVTILTNGNSQRVQFSTEDFILRNTLVSTDKGEIRLYFPNNESGLLSAEYRTVTLSEDVSLERVILDELLKGPNSGRLSPALPEGTVAWPVYTQDGVCTVSFSEDFLTSLFDNTEQIRLAVYAVVNSLTCLKDVDSVRIIVQNNEDNLIGNIDISEPLTRKPSLISSAVFD